ncbi:hypothetical protein WJX73_001935 [Symbiochloris irregularis]|uniref:LisH domain-containing protein n=1 Tax=Symbiochloris irregularis TaxID=706552 RepID=A0AAW1PZK5_9CHLO
MTMRPVRSLGAELNGAPAGRPDPKSLTHSREGPKLFHLVALAASSLTVGSSGKLRRPRSGLALIEKVQSRASSMPAAAPSNRPLPSNSAVSVPAKDLTAFAAHIQEADKGTSVQSVVALNQVCETLERAELQYVELVGDPQLNPAQRSHYPIGQYLRQLSMFDTACTRMHDRWTFNAAAALDQRVAGLRFLLAQLSTWQFHQTVEDTFTPVLKAWATEDANKQQRRGDAELDPHTGVLREARRAYAAGLLAIGLSDKEVCEEAVRSGVVSDLARYLNRAVPTVYTTAEAFSEEAAGIVGCSEPAVLDVTPPQPSRLSTPTTSRGIPYIPAAGSAIQVLRTTHHDLRTPDRHRQLTADESPGPADEHSDLLLLSAMEQAGTSLTPETEAEAVRAVGQARSREVDRLRRLRIRGTVQCLSCMGEYQECLGPLLAERCVDVVLALVADWRPCSPDLVEALRLLCSLLAHRRVAEQLVDKGAVQLLLSLPHSQHTRGYVSMALFCLASVPQVLEQMASLPAPIPEQLISAALAFLTSGLDPARCNGAQFLAIALPARSLLVEFDRQGGQARLLSVLRATLSLLRSPHGDLRTDKQVGYHASAALQRYFWSHLVIQAAAMSKLSPGSSGNAKQGLPSAAQPLQMTVELIEESFAVLHRTGLAAATVGASPLAQAIDAFLRADGCPLMLEFVQVCPGEKYFNEMAKHSLNVLRVATLALNARSTLEHATSQSQQTSMAVMLAAASGQAFQWDHEVMLAALMVIANLVKDPSAAQVTSSGDCKQAQLVPEANVTAEQPSMQGSKPEGRDKELATAARAAVRAAGGIRILIGLLSPRTGLSTTALDLRAVAAYCLLGLAQDPALCRILARLQLPRLLAELVHEPSNGIGSGESPTALYGCATTMPLPGLSHAMFNKIALQLIALTTSGIGTGSSVASADSPGPALLKLEREAIAAATQITYPESELMRDLMAAMEEAGCNSSNHSSQTLAAPPPQPPKTVVKPAPPVPGISTSAPRRTLTVAPSLLSTGASAPCVTPLKPSRPASSSGAAAAPPSKAISAAAGLASPPDRRCMHARRNSALPSGDSKLSGIVMQYLRQQHRQACMQAPVPIATLPPLSLLSPSPIPEAKRSLDASRNLAMRLRQRETCAPCGGDGGRRRDRHQQFGRFRQMRSLRDADAALLRSCAFVNGSSSLAVGCHAGSMQILDVVSGEVLSASESPHTLPVNQVRVWEAPSNTLTLSSTRLDVRLWHNFELATFTPYVGMRNAIFHPQGQHFAAVASAGRQACIWDINRAETRPWILEDTVLNNAAVTAAASGRLSKDTVCFNGAGDLLLHGPLLWDWRCPQRVHCFDVFSDTPGSGSFQPSGLEVVLNSEVWDLRTLRLLRSVPCLDGTVLTWTGSGDAAFASLRRMTDDLHSPVSARRARHSLHTAFRTVDACGYTEIATVGMDGRMVLDLAVDSSDALVAVATVEPHELASSSVRIYKIGAHQLQGDEGEDDEGMSAGSGGDDDDDEDDDDPSMPWQGISAELAALSTPGSVGMRAAVRHARAIGSASPIGLDDSTSSDAGDEEDEVAQGQDDSAAEDGSQRDASDAASLSDSQSEMTGSEDGSFEEDEEVEDVLSSDAQAMDDSD